MNIKKLDKRAIMPKYATLGSAGADLYALLDEDIVIKPGETKLIHTGIAMEIESGYVGLIYARSGISLKKDLAPANKVGVIDSDYRGEIMVALHNHGNLDRVVEKFERIAQIVFTKYEKFEFNLVEELNDTNRGTGGYGSTGTK
ncbi:dUTP diphosphatase [Oceanivirga miroungae]|uniref:dUTP diphosphatase n=1 Tax=Oceanivirga miroungae TaxID=1130046 RepID=A0A6I8MDX6_9FUSO|nr:dUTP diphosphatase [Oceanivirga miroungae]VWL85747.1 Deoxyuridine 5'-triphosphate nucleotidohydrolase [Oceanivirga miroungae]